jgi:signal transduction histidine kinase
MQTGNDPAFNHGPWPAMAWSGDFWVGLLDRLGFPVLVLEDPDRVVLANAEARRILDFDGPDGGALPSRLWDLAIRPATPNPSGRRQVRIRTGDGAYVFTIRSLESSGVPGLEVAAGVPERARLNGLSDEAADSGAGAALASEVSRGVKGPLAGIELYASILDEELSGGGPEGLGTIVEGIRRGVMEVNEYLTSFESMTRDLVLRPERVALSSVVDEALEAMGGIFKAKGVGVLVDQKDLSVLADRALLVQLFMNLALNSVEAMPHGGRLMVDIRGGAPGMAEVVITDTGPGVDPLRLKEIFNPFYTTKTQPLGLGLPVSRRIAEAHHGSVRVGLGEPCGARVSVTLPMADQDGEAGSGFRA